MKHKLDFPLKKALILRKIKFNLKIDKALLIMFQLIK